MKWSDFFLMLFWGFTAIALAGMAYVLMLELDKMP